jgi:hypothetical protein
VSSARGMLLPDVYFPCPFSFLNTRAHGHELFGSCWMDSNRRVKVCCQCPTSQRVCKVHTLTRTRTRTRTRTHIYIHIHTHTEPPPPNTHTHTQLAFGCPCLDGHTRKLHYFWGICAAHMHSQHLSERAYVSIRQHTSAYVSIRQHTHMCTAPERESIGQHTSADVSIRAHFT